MTLYPPGNLSRVDQLRWLTENDAFDHWGRLNHDVRIDKHLHTVEKDRQIWLAGIRWERRRFG